MTTDIRAAEYELIVSFVLYDTPLEEISRAVSQVLTSPISAHVVLVDNSEIKLDQLELDAARVTAIRSGANIGYGKGHNIAFEKTAGWAPFHVAMNTDVVYGRDVLPTMIAYMRNHPDVGLAMPRVCYPDGRIQWLCRLLPHPLDIFGRGFFGRTAWTRRRNDRYEFRHWNYDKEAEFPFLSGCFMMLRRTIIDRIGGFDDRFFMYGEDVDLSRRVNAVARTMFVPTAEIEHEYRSEGNGSRRRTWYKIVNLARYFNKWGWLIDRDRDAINRQTVATIAALVVSERRTPR